MIKKILVSIGVLVLLMVSVAFALIQYNESLEPPQLTANFVDLDKVWKISKFRSCAGHTTIPQDGRELKRNMKHYITLHPEHRKENFVEVYSPYNGHIALILKEEIWVAPGTKSLLNILPFNRWMFSVIHVKPRDGLSMGDKVSAGELIGYGTFLQFPESDAAFDAVYGKMNIPPKKVDNWSSPYGDLDSPFNHLSAGALAEYEQKGVTRKNIILSAEERDKDPCVYRDGGPYFGHKIISDDWVDLQH